MNRELLGYINVYETGFSQLSSSLEVADRRTPATGKLGTLVVYYNTVTKDKIVEFIPIKTAENKPPVIGTLNRQIGLKGYFPCTVGTPVYDLGDKYVVYAKHEKLQDFPITYYKEDLASIIDFK